ncbi:MAG: substrate-binding domain-containing protein [Spirochaetales bacterium]|nr:substrate-binding domain-containing protein [Spirochaetales bacterium]
MKSNPMKSRKPGIAFFAFNLQTPYAIRICISIGEAAKKSGFNHFIFPGNNWKFSPENYLYQHSMIYNLIDPTNIDVIISSAGSMNILLEPEEYREFLESLHPIPVINIGYKLEGYPSILVNGKPGFSTLLSHLIEEHQHKRIAFIKGPAGHAEAEERFSAYTETLSKHGLPVDEGLIAPGIFTPESGRDAAIELIRRGIPFDALACANDEMAISAMDVLRENGIKVPGDVAVVGFDNSRNSEFSLPPLSTVNQPLKMIGQKAVDMAKCIIEGEKCGDVTLDTYSVIRKSCGCCSRSIRLMRDQPVNLEADDIPGQEIVEKLITRFPMMASRKNDLLVLINLLSNIVRKKMDSSSFISRMEEIINSQISRDEDITSWQDILTTIHMELSLHFSKEEYLYLMHNAVDEARIITGEYLQVESMLRRNQSISYFFVISDVIQKINSTLTIDELMTVIKNQVPRLGIPGCYLCLYSQSVTMNYGERKKTPEWSELILAYGRDGEIKIDPTRKTFPTRQLTPAGILPDDRSMEFIVTPLFFRDEHMGFIIFEHTPNTGFEVYENLRLQISSALKGSSLLLQMEKSEKELHKANEKLTELDKSKTNFFSNISHELRTPLTLILGPIESILEGNYKKSLAYNDEILTSMHTNSLRLLKLINNLLDFTKIEAGKMDVKKRYVDITKLVSFFITQVAPASRNKNINLFIDKPDKDIIAFIDTDLLEKAFFNIISNALKFTPPGGTISIKIGEHAPVNGNKMLFVSISDSGIGIPADKLRIIFERFTQVDSSSSRKFAGTGIGLSFSKEIIELQGGSIEVESNVNKGSTFHLVLPAATNVPKDKIVTDFYEAKPFWFSDLDIPLEKKENKTKRVTTRKSVLIIDDNADMRNFLKLIMEKENFSVLLAEDGKAGLETARNTKPDIILSDVMMPELDGLEMTRIIKRDRELSGTPVILLTAKRDIISRIEGLEQGADDYLAKPFNARELLARVHSNLEMKKLRDSIQLQRDLLAEKKIDLEKLVRIQTEEIEKEKDNAVFLRKRAEKQLEEFLLVLAAAIESKDMHTKNHVDRVASYSRDIAMALEFDESQIQSIFLGAAVHDVGKIGVKDSILNKTGRLTDEEVAAMRLHPVIGKSLLEKIENIGIPLEIAYSHQERWDGKGYPLGLKGEEIPLTARIVTLADYWDAITSDRPYRKAMHLKSAVKLMHEERGKAFDPKLFDIFMNDENKIYLRYMSEEQLQELE